MRFYCLKNFLPNIHFQIFFQNWIIKAAKIIMIIKNKSKLEEKVYCNSLMSNVTIKEFVVK